MTGGLQLIIVSARERRCADMIGIFLSSWRCSRRTRYHAHPHSNSVLGVSLYSAGWNSASSPSSNHEEFFVALLIAGIALAYAQHGMPLDGIVVDLFIRKTKRKSEKRNPTSGSEERTKTDHENTKGRKREEEGKS